MSEPIQQPEPQQQPQEGTPPWGDDFDPERAWNLVKNLREDNAKLKARPTLTDEDAAKLSQFRALEEASKSELERAQEELTRWQNEATTWRTKAVSSRVETLAADKFADPSDALAAIDPASYLGAGGDIDEARITADLDALLERKPHWRKGDSSPAAPRVPAPNPAQGSGGGSAPPADPAQAFAAHVKGLLR